MSDGLGKTKGQGQNSVDTMSDIVASSGSTLPQVSSNGGYISGTYHIVTTVSFLSMSSLSVLAFLGVTILT